MYPQGYVEGQNDARTKLAGFFSILLYGFLNFSTAETACAHPNSFWLTINQCTDWLKVGLEDPLGLVIRVTDIMA